eukprot:scaffold1559_cov114-Cylindrotheca_fusiformis.AAC.5
MVSVFQGKSNTNKADALLSPSSSLLFRHSTNKNVSPRTTTTTQLWESNSSNNRQRWHAAPSSTPAIIVESINEMFPPHTLEERIALSRKDGYWPYISTGEEPPKELIYGEFDVDFFINVVEYVLHHLYDNDNENAKVFCDLGSGTGKLVLAAAALDHPWDLVRGIELLPSIHETAVQNLKACRETTRHNDESETEMADDQKTSSAPTTSTVSTSIQKTYWKQYQQFSPSDDWMNQLLSENFDNDDNDDDDDTTNGLYLPYSTTTSKEKETTTNTKEPTEETTTTTTSASASSLNNETYVLGEKHELPLSPIQLSCGSFDDPYEFFGDADIIFCFSSAMPRHIIHNHLAKSIGRQCVPGTIIITTEYPLPTSGIIDPYYDDSNVNDHPNVPHGRYELELVEEIHGQNEATGGESTVFIHRLTKSLGTGHPISRPPVRSVSDMCYNAIQKLNDENDPQKFLRKVSNQMIFLGLPESWLPNINNNG